MGMQYLYAVVYVCDWVAILARTGYSCNAMQKCEFYIIFISTQLHAISLEVNAEFSRKKKLGLCTHPSSAFFIICSIG